jgi:hypothetical protein
MNKVWRKKGLAGVLSYPILWLASLSDILFIESGENVAFELNNEITFGANDSVTMTWDRKFHFPSGTRRFFAVMTFDQQRAVLMDYFGRYHFLEAELHPQAIEGALLLVSGRQHLRLGGIRLPIPRLLAGNATIKEWEESDGMMRISVTVSNALIGDFFGYEGRFSKVS